MRRRLSGNTVPILAFGTIAVTTFMLAQGEKKPASDVIFTSVDQCVASGRDQRLCLLSYQDVTRAYAAKAPRFNDMTSCETEFGSGQCAEQQATPSTFVSGTGLSGGTTAGNRSFSPRLAAYSFPDNIRNVDEYSSYRQSLSQNGLAYGSTPIYRNRKGELVVSNDDDRSSSSSHGGGGGGGSGFHSAESHSSGRGGFGGAHTSGG